MKPIRLDWSKTPYSRGMWIAIIGLGGIGLCVLLLYWGVYGRDLSVVSAQIIEAQHRLRPTSRQASDARHDAERRAERLLRLDLNPALRAVEQIDVKGAVLKLLSVDVSAGVIRIAFELDDFSKASTVDEQLNAGDSVRPWKMGSIRRIDGHAAVQQASVSAQRAEGAWVAEIKLIGR